MIPQILGAVIPLIDKIIPDKEAAAQAKLELLKQQQHGELKGIEHQLSAIIAEAKSADPWTSRARPSFLYVIYALILFSLPMGFISAYEPEIAKNITAGFQGWLGAIPEPIVALFGAGYLGYTGARTLDKRNQAKKEQLPWQ